MKSILTIILLSFTLSNICFSQVAKPGPAVESPADILKNDNSFNQYLAENLYNLTANYSAYNTDGKLISKLAFLKQIASGYYLFVKLNSGNSALNYRLYRLNTAGEKEHGEIIYAYTRMMYENYKMVGKKFPTFDFTDINGNRFTSQNTKGKIIVLKYWFIGCLVCVQEMPDLNQLVKQYKNRSDILFISIAPDSKAQLQAFFSKREFDYAKVPGQSKLINDILKLQEAPTHFVINKQGIIVNVVDNPQELAYSLKNDI